MTAPSYVVASTGSTDTTGAWTHTSAAPGAAGRLLLVQVMQDGTTTGASMPTITSVTNAEDLAGTDSVLTYLGAWPMGSTTAAYQHLWMGRSLSTSAMVITGGNTGGDDVYVRVYEFLDVNTGTGISDVIENTLVADITQDVADTQDPVGYSSAQFEMSAQSFTAVGSVGSVSLSLFKNNSPTDDYVCEIQTDSAGNPSSTVLASDTVLSSTVSGIAAEMISFQLPVGLTVGTTYWIVLRRTGALDTSNNLQWERNVASVYAEGGAKSFDSGSWQAIGTGSDYRFILYGLAPNSVGTSATAADTAVTTTGSDRLALQFGAVNDDNAIDSVSNPVGTWLQVVAEYATATGTDGAIEVKSAPAVAAGTYGGDEVWSITDIDAWGVIGFALIGTPSAPPVYVPRHSAHDFGSITHN